MPRKSKKRNIEVGIRDRKLFNYLYENKIATRDQICRDIPWNVTRQVFERRMRILMDANLIEAKAYIGVRNHRAYTLGNRAFKEYISSGTNLRKEYKSQSVLHDIPLVDIRWMISNAIQTQQYYTENVLKGSGRSLLGSDYYGLLDRHPDAVARLKFPSTEFYVAVEYERSQKYGDRYEELFRSYYADKIIPAVLYVCDTPKIEAHLKYLEQKTIKNEKRKFFYTTLDKMLQSDTLEFINLNNKKITLNPAHRLGSEYDALKVRKQPPTKKSKPKLSIYKHSESSYTELKKNLLDYIASWPVFPSVPNKPLIVSDILTLISLYSARVRPDHPVSAGTVKDYCQLDFSEKSEEVKVLKNAIENFLETS